MGSGPAEVVAVRIDPELRAAIDARAAAGDMTTSEFMLCDAVGMGSPERWQVSGSAAEKYERFVASWFSSWATDLVERASLQPGWQILDVACGTGIVTRAAGPVIGPTGTIVASDLNEDMLTEARRHAVAGAPVQWRQADAADLPFDDETFDALLCQQGLQFVPANSEAVAEMRRVLRPGGVAAVSVWRSAEHNPYISALADGLSLHLSPDAGQTMLAPCGLGDRDVLSGLFVEAGFSSVDVHTVTLEREPMDAAEAIGGNLAALPIAEQIQAMGPDAHTRMIDDIVDSLADYVSNGELTSPNSAYIAVAFA
jgi:ubiquinone/menaquinone biosynthesis C-methylase UbiE